MIYMETLSFKRRKVGNKIFFCTHAVSSTVLLSYQRASFFFRTSKLSIQLTTTLFFSSTDTSFLFTRKILGKIFSELTST